MSKPHRQNAKILSEKALSNKLKAIRLFATDVDGVLTDGGTYSAESGDESIKLNMRDGIGIKLLHNAGISTAIVTQERSKMVAKRAEKLMIAEVHQGCLDKLSVVREMAERRRFTLMEVAYIGDDIIDAETLVLSAFRRHRLTETPRWQSSLTMFVARRVEKGLFAK